MKRALIFSAPVISYLAAYGVTKSEEQLVYIQTSPVQAFVFKCIFFILLGTLLCYFSRQLVSQINYRITQILCITGIILPAALWVFLIKHAAVGNPDYYLLVYFLYLGGCLNAGISYLLTRKQ